jgi:ubiquinone biosynthesis protein COQ4
MEHAARLAGPPHRRRDWPRAWRALRNLIDDPERTDQVFEIVRALSGDAFERAFQRFAATREGRELLAERPSLLATLSDRDALHAMPEGSFGRAYAAFMDAGRLDAAGLVDAEQMANERFADEGPEDPDRQFFGDRLRDMHDLWHVLTGYGRDEAGEAANLAFTLGQVWNFGIAVIVLAAAIEGPKDVTLHWQRYLYRAWQRGRRAALLSTAAYERLLPLPLDAVRRRLGIAPAAQVHPSGIVVANRGEEAQFIMG